MYSLVFCFFHSVLWFWEFICAVVHISMLFLFIAEKDSALWMYHVWFTHFSVDGYLVCFHILVIMNKAAEDICTWKKRSSGQSDVCSPEILNCCNFCISHECWFLQFSHTCHHSDCCHGCCQCHHHSSLFMSNHFLTSLLDFT